jgi:hypothetical protein
VSEWWFDVVDGTIVDPASYISPDKDIPLIPRTRNSLGIPDTYFPGATALFPREGLPDGIRLDLLVWTSSESWLEKDLFSGEVPEFEEQVDKKGPHAIGAFVSTAPVDGNEASSEPSLVVLGDSDFAANQHSSSGGNGELFLACVKWLAADREVVSVDRKVLPVRRLVLTPEEVRFLHVSAIGLLPLLLLIVGVCVWWRRR